MATITINDAYQFWAFLEEKNRHLYLRLRSHRVSPADVVAVQPATLSDELYAEYLEILRNWLEARGLLEFK